MQRWHQQREQNKMFREWKKEMGQHGYDWRNPPTDPSACHCAKGIGSMRKQRAGGHHHHCLLCNGDKYLMRGNRLTNKRRAIEDSLA